MHTHISAASTRTHTSATSTHTHLSVASMHTHLSVASMEALRCDTRTPLASALQLPCALRKMTHNVGAYHQCAVLCITRQPCAHRSSLHAGSWNALKVREHIEKGPRHHLCHEDHLHTKAAHGRAPVYDPLKYRVRHAEGGEVLEHAQKHLVATMWHHPRVRQGSLPAQACYPKMRQVAGGLMMWLYAHGKMHMEKCPLQGVDHPGPPPI